jgi:hypothetical protein
MKRISIKTALALCVFGFSLQAFAGNKDRTGQAGATELLINPWGQGTGVFGLNGASVKGIESMKTNIAGLAFVQGTEFGLSHTILLRGSKVTVSDFGVAQKMGNFGVIGLNIMSMGFGDITIVDDNNPEGGIGSYKPQFLNISAGFAKEFSNSIHAGLGVTFVSEQISDIRANGACFEAGVQYVTGKRDNFHFGVTLRNVGTNMRFSGPGFSINTEAPENPNYTINMQVPTEKFEMPTYLNFGASYDFYLDGAHLKEDEMPKHRATIMGSFISNSFNNDNLGLAVEYAFKETIMLRGGYRYEKNISNAETSSTFYTGLAAGVTVQKGIGEKGPLLAIDYSYRPTQQPSNGVHTFSLRFMTRKAKKEVAAE